MTKPITTLDLGGRIHAVGRAQLLDEGTADDRLKAWAEHHVRSDKDIGWVLGNYVEADRANSNGHIFPLADLESYGCDTVGMKPLNMLHHERYIVGAFAAGKMLYPDAAEVAAAADVETAPHPRMEALSAMWKSFFPDEHSLVQRAHKEGSLFYSMECQPETMTCPECTNTYPFQGLTHESYCGHLNASRISAKVLNKMHFHAGALIVPPVQPGWSKADISTLAEKIANDPAGAESLYSAFEGQAPHLDSKAWEHLMGMVMLAAEDATV